MIHLTKLRVFILILLLVLTVLPFFASIFKLAPESAIIPLYAYSAPPPNISIWSSDFHISPVADIKDLLKIFDAKVLDKSLSGHCHLTKTCQTDLRVLNQENGIELAPCPNMLHKRFYNSYVGDEEFQSADAILCTHACSMCEIFMPFGKPLIVVASTRYEIGRYDAKRWTEWNRNLQRIASHSNNVIAANNMYDLEYIKYFTGIRNVQYLPSYCGYVNAKYAPSRKEILIAPGRGTNSDLVNKLVNAADTARLAVSPLRDLYPNYEFTDLAAHPAFILMPYQVSFMLFFELYRMNIPMFAPSPELLASWHIQRNVLGERTWFSALYQQPSSGSNIRRHPDSASSLMSDPNNDLNVESVLEWIKLADFYVFPHVTTFTSFDHLMDLLKRTDLNDVARKMEMFNAKQKQYITSKWSDVLKTVKAKRGLFVPGFSRPVLRQQPRDFTTALEEEYQAHLSEDCVGSDDIPGSIAFESVKDLARLSTTSATGGFQQSRLFGGLYFLVVFLLTLLIYLMMKK